MKQYFIKDHIFSMSMEEVKAYMMENELSEMTVFKAKKIKVEGMRFCKIDGMFEHFSDACGRNWCNNYDPRNGKSGCCKHLGSLYELGEEITVKIK